MLKELRNLPKSVYPINGMHFSVFISYDQRLDIIEDTKDIIKRYKEDVLNDNGRNVLKYRVNNDKKLGNLSLFDKNILSSKRFSKTMLEGYAEKIFYYYPTLCSSRLAAFIPEHQSHLLKNLPKKHNEYSIELKLHNLYFENDISEGLPLKEVKKLPLNKQKKLFPEECTYIKVDECSENKLVMAIDPIYLLRYLIHPIFLEKKKKGFDPFLDFAYDMAHEWEHFLRLDHLKGIGKEEEEYYKQAVESKKRDFYLNSLFKLIAEEGIANYAVYSKDPFYFFVKIPQRFRKKLENTLKVKDLEDYTREKMSLDYAYRKDEATTYYIGEAACYLISLLLEKELGKKLINLHYNNKDIEPDEISKILKLQEFRRVPLLFSSSLDQYLVTYDYIHNLDHKEFFDRLEEAQKMLNLNDEHKLFVKEEFDNLVDKAKNIPLIN
jgi:hypothetical protein